MSQTKLSLFNLEWIINDDTKVKGVKQSKNQIKFLYAVFNSFVQHD